MIVLTPKVQLQVTPPSGAWTDVSADVVGDVAAEWGVRGSGLTDRVADVGTMSFALDNSSNNAGSLRGYYTPGMAGGFSGFRVGMGARLVINHALFGDRVMWVGKVVSILPLPGAKAPLTRVSCEDWMADAESAKLTGLDVQIDSQSDVLFDLVVSALDRQPPNGVVIGSGSDVYPFSFDTIQDEKDFAIGEIQRIVMSEFGLAYVAAGELVFEGRRQRGGGGSVRFAMSEDEEIVDLVTDHSAARVINRSIVSVHPRRRDSAATTVLFSLGVGSPPQIPRQVSVVLNCPYKDPDQRAQRVGGVDMVQPVATTDYLFNALEDGTGQDLTTQLTVTAVYSGNSATVTVTNNGPLDGFVTKLQLRGRGLYDFEPINVDQKDQDSADLYGEVALGFDMPYQSSTENARDLGQFIITLNKDVQTRVDSVTFVANWSDEVAEQALFLRISERVSITSPTLDLDAVPHFVNGVRLQVRSSGLTVVTWILAPVDTSQFWLLGVDGRTELDQTTVLGYGFFVAGWILGTSELGADTFLN